MKIAILIDSAEVIGGVGKICISEVNYLKDNKYDAKLLVFNGNRCNDIYKKKLKSNPVFFQNEKNIIYFNKKIPLFNFLNFNHFLYFFNFFFQKKKWDLIFVHESYHILTLFIYKLLFKTKIVYCCWDPSSYIVKKVYLNNKRLILPYKKFIYFFSKIYDQFCFKIVDKILITGKMHKEYFKQYEYKVNYYMPILDFNFNHKFKKTKSNNFLIHTAWKDGKNIDLLFKISKDFKDYKFIVSGIWLNKNFKLDVIKKIRNESISNIRIIGEVNENKLNNLYQNSICLLQLSSDRGFGLPAIEASKNKTSFIIPLKQNVCQYFRNNIDFFQYKENSYIQLKNKINNILENDSYLCMGLKSFESFKKFISKSQKLSISNFID